MLLTELEKELKKQANKEYARNLQRYFKTGKGEYGEGDIFIGIQVPKLRKIALQFSDLSLKEIQVLLNSKIHEKRMLALFILTKKYKSEKESREKIFNFYLKNTKNINNWDLVDLSSINIIGNYLLNKDRKILYKLAKSKYLWERRIAIISTFEFIRNNQLQDTINISKILLKDKQDLIHKAVGWGLREVGKRDKKELIKFLNKYSKVMPRTMLRYSLEKLDKKEKEKYMGR